MEYIVPGLLGLSILLFIISFFIKDPYKEIKNELDQFSMQQIQEIYQLKRKIKVLEEELLIDDRDFQTASSFPEPKKEIHAIIKNQVWSLAQQGVSVAQIAKQSSLTKEDVKDIINELSAGVRYE
ncbi:hypothetical protein J27TS8_04580 [Robertmurraya siralis]|uniref:Uncharacterized protein n=1 Tax=Robertmurraya siralis TaxID=77777 RepID=A0A919WEH7_9BACI|nr:hypothetical protein [Robertmurraya siralis]GIN60465.1 hypothetical protein J27TS8_04580 [Robertmurraya siralis]